MIEAAAEAAHDKIQLLGVTVLTSMQTIDLQEVGVLCTPAPRMSPPIAQANNLEPSVAWQVEKLAWLANRCHINGLVCSAHEAKSLRDAYPNATIVVPGIRPAGADAHDQKRVATPAFAREQGASFIVVGRPIRDAAPDARAKVVKAILDELETP
jgi:orotidine-5'-phosphate decarboxylase